MSFSNEKLLFTKYNNQKEQFNYFSEELQIYYFLLAIEITLIILTQILIIFSKENDLTSVEINNSNQNNKKEICNYNELNLQDNEVLENRDTFNNNDEHNEKNLYNNYLIIFTLARSAMWLKAPYVIINYFRLGYSMQNISFLYFLDLVVALISGPLLGGYGDIYGRKRLSSFYFIFTSIDMFFKIQGNVILIYLSAFVNGFTTVLIHNAFESWINNKAKKDIHCDEKRLIFLKKLFKDVYIWDSIASLICSIISLVLYVRYYFYLRIGKV